MKIGEQLKRLRKKSGLTQMELSQKLNIVQSLISAVENDKGSTTTELLERWVDACKGRLVIFGSDPPTEIPPSFQPLLTAASKLSPSDLERLTALAETLGRVDGLTGAMLRTQIDGSLDLLKNIRLFRPSAVRLR